MSNNFPQEPTASGRKRSVPKLVIGIILTVIGGLGLLGRLAQLGSGRGSFIPSDAAEATGYLVGILLAIALPLLVGILLIIKSRPKQSD